jgi:hypothetical protein
MVAQYIDRAALGVVLALGVALAGCGDCESSAQTARQATGALTYVTGDGTRFVGDRGELSVDRAGVTVTAELKSTSTPERRSVRVFVPIAEGYRGPLDLASAGAELCVTQSPSDGACRRLAGTAVVRDKHLDCRGGAQGVSACIDHVDSAIDARAEGGGVSFLGKLDLRAQGEWQQTECRD